MQDTKRILLTGATGFLGSHLCDALVRSGHHVVALARNEGTHTCRDRVVDVLDRVAPSSDTSTGRSKNLEVIEGDISHPRLGLDDTAYNRLLDGLDEVWHCAASLSFFEEDREEIFRMNLEGTQNVIALVTKIPSQRLHHVSTAYVAGRRTGRVSEDEIDRGQKFKNPYEESKYEAELFIRRCQDEGRLSASVYRPSIVIGDSRSGKATHFHGVYAFIRGLWTLARRLRRAPQGSDALSVELRIRGSDSSTLNFVPIDYVTRAIETIAIQDSSEGKVFHIVNPKATVNRLWKQIVCDQLGVEGVELVGESSFAARPMSRLETLFHRQMAFYYPYLESEPVFDCSLTVHALEGTSVECPEVTPEFARRMTGWYIDQLN